MKSTKELAFRLEEAQKTARVRLDRALRKYEGERAEMEKALEQDHEIYIRTLERLIKEAQALISKKEKEENGGHI